MKKETLDVQRMLFSHFSVAIFLGEIYLGIMQLLDFLP